MNASELCRVGCVGGAAEVSGSLPLILNAMEAK